MLFDLRRRGRRRTVKVIYLGLALLMFVGLVGFGVGTGLGGGGLFNAVSENNGGGEATFAKQITAARKRIKRDPSEAAAWAALTEAQLHEADSGEYYDQTTSEYTAKGKEYIAKIAADWNQYLSLEANHPSASLANKVLVIFGEEGLNQPAAAVRALEILIPSRPPSAALYADLAEYAYKAKYTSQGELAAKKAEALATSSERPLLKEELEKAKATASSSTSTTPTATTTPATTG